MARAAPSRNRRFAPIPRRIPALTWRAPFVIWTPVAIALAIGWPALALYGQPGLFEICLFGGAIGVAAVIIALGVAWMTKRPPRTRLAVVRITLLMLVGIAVLSPFVLSGLIAAAPTPEGVERDAEAVSGAGLAMFPLALMVGLPIALFSGLVFSIVALVKPPGPRTQKPPPLHEAEPDFEYEGPAREVQPFY